jgi:hypothetical protein
MRVSRDEPPVARCESLPIVCKAPRPSPTTASLVGGTADTTVTKTTTGVTMDTTTGTTATVARTARTSIDDTTPDARTALRAAAPYPSAGTLVVPAPPAAQG